MARCTCLLTWSGLLCFSSFSIKGIFFCNRIPLFSTCLLHVFHGLPNFLWTSTWNSSIIHRASPSSLLKTSPYHCTRLAFVRFISVRLNPRISLEYFLSISSMPHIALTIILLVCLKIDTLFFTRLQSPKVAVKFLYISSNHLATHCDHFKYFVQS